MKRHASLRGLVGLSIQAAVCQPGPSRQVRIFQSHKLSFLFLLLSEGVLKFNEGNFSHFSLTFPTDTADEADSNGSSVFIRSIRFNALGICIPIKPHSAFAHIFKTPSGLKIHCLEMRC